MHVPLASLSFASLAAAALPEGVIEIPLQRIKNQSAYGAEFQVGNPPQRVIISADSGSPTYAFESPRTYKYLLSYSHKPQIYRSCVLMP